MRYNFSIIHTPGKFFYIPDTLSRSPLPQSNDLCNLQEPVAAYIASVEPTLPAAPQQLVALWVAQNQDEVLSDTLVQSRLARQKAQLPHSRILDGQK